VETIEKAMGEPLNVIIPEQDQNVQLPALKMRQVMVVDLFAAMEQSSRRAVAFVTGTYFSSTMGEQSQYSQQETSFGFRKVGSVWVFSNKEVTPPPRRAPAVKASFYQLEPYLDRHSVEDITTAIQTAWKMKASRQGANLTELKFHKETGLLIAVGDMGQIQMIDDVLNALRPDLTPRNPPLKQPEPSSKTNAPAKKPATEH